MTLARAASAVNSPPPCGQGNRIWNFRVFSAAWTLADVLLEPTLEESDREQNGIEIGTPPLSRAKALAATNDCIQQNFHMRYPCPGGGGRRPPSAAVLSAKNAEAKLRLCHIERS